MKIFFNGLEGEINEETSLESLLRENGIIDAKGIAAAVNDCIVPKLQWKETILKNGDRALVITASRGG